MSSEQYLYCWIYYTCLFYFICSTCWGNTHRKNNFIWTCPPCKITKWKDLLKRHLFMSLKRFPQKDKLLVKLVRKVKRILFLLNTSPNSTIQTKDLLTRKQCQMLLYQCALQTPKKPAQLYSQCSTQCDITQLKTKSTWSYIDDTNEGGLIFKRKNALWEWHLTRLFAEKTTFHLSFFNQIELYSVVFW